MKKKVVSMLLSFAMITSVLAGCGGKDAETIQSDSSNASSNT